MKIEADGDAGDGEPRDQNACNEIVRRTAPPARASKRSTIAPSSPVAARSRSFARSSVRRNSGSLRPEEAARMRLEGVSARRRPDSVLARASAVRR